MKDERRETKRLKMGDRYQAKLVLTSEFGVKDISMNGIGVKTSMFLKIGNTYRFEFANLKKEKIQLLCKVVNCFLKTSQKVNDDLLPIYEVGLTFSGLTKKEKQFLEQFINEYSVKERRRFKRTDKIIEVVLIDNRVSVHAGSSKNFSKKGICIWTYTEYLPGKKLSLELHPSSKEKIKVSGKVKWIDRTRFREKGNRIGIELISSRSGTKYLKFLKSLNKP